MNKFKPLNQGLKIEKEEIINFLSENITEIIKVDDDGKVRIDPTKSNPIGFTNGNIFMKKPEKLNEIEEKEKEKKNFFSKGKGKTINKTTKLIFFFIIKIKDINKL